MADIKGESIALAALFQCCNQIQRIAKTGYYDDKAMICVIRALLVTDPNTVEDIYNPSDLLPGFRQIAECLEKGEEVKTPQTVETTKLALKLVALAISIEKSSRIYAKLSDEIDGLKKAMGAEGSKFMEGDPNEVIGESTLHTFGALYTSLISPNFSKLLIYGEERFLSQTVNQDRIRSLLLAGIRAVILWRQLGGKRRFLFFRRKDIVQYCKKQL